MLLCKLLTRDDTTCAAFIKPMAMQSKTMLAHAIRTNVSAKCKAGHQACSCCRGLLHPTSGCLWCPMSTTHRSSKEKPNIHPGPSSQPFFCRSLTVTPDMHFEAEADLLFLTVFLYGVQTPCAGAARRVCWFFPRHAASGRPPCSCPCMLEDGKDLGSVSLPS